MYLAARFVAVDDKLAHANAVRETLERLGTTCLPVIYDPALPPDPKWFRAARVIFMDFHLNGLSVGTDSKRHHSAIASLLLEVMGPHPHPYVLVLWTEFPAEAADLFDFLRARLSANPRVVPMSVLFIDKNVFLNVATGAVTDPAALQREFDSKLSQLASIAAAFDWEYSALEGVSAVLDRLGRVLPDQAFVDGTVGDELDTLLSQLAHSSAGSEASADAKSAVNYALSPLVADQILNQATSAMSSGVWKEGVTHTASPPSASQDRRAQFNAMAHLASADHEFIRASDWGAVVVAEENERWFLERLQISRKDFLEKNLRLTSSDAAQSKFVLIRAGAECDFAQQKNGPLPYLAGAIVPFRKNFQTAPASVKRSVVLAHEGIWPGGTTFAIHVDTRVLLTVSLTYTKRWSALARIREPMMTQIVAFQGAYSARPGILEF